ncbi:MAG TPA: vitamin K epoxide reductase family protein [Candidatus Saccharimonas sp.]|nr:vitamin K epoxide reductase family protein [Candidatus Saccharimonas sp.]
MNTPAPAHGRAYSWLLVVAGAFGLLASIEITYDKFQSLANPAYTPACSLNPVISCGSVMKTAQAAAFGLPNSWFGLICFAAVMVVGFSLLAGATFRPWYWRLFNAGSALGAIFVLWLAFQSIYVIHALCPWCMVVWVVTLAVFWYTTLRNLRAGVWPTPPLLAPVIRPLQTYRHLIVVLGYLVILIAVLVQFWYYWRTLL